jgi:3-phenylpropionate/trans-cinnamate dioxygenase ferredoxin subunit
MEHHVVARTSEIEPGGRKRVTVKGRDIVVFNVGGEFFALLDKCPHKGGSLCAGWLAGQVESSVPGEYRYSRRGEVIRCAWHSWEFDIRTGRSYCDPARVRAQRFEAHVGPGAQIVEGPYIAETFPVTVEDEYVIVDV